MFAETRDQIRPCSLLEISEIEIKLDEFKKKAVNIIDDHQSININVLLKKRSKSIKMFGPNPEFLVCVVCMLEHILVICFVVLCEDMHADVFRRGLSSMLSFKILLTG